MHYPPRPRNRFRILLLFCKPATSLPKGKRKNHLRYQMMRLLAFGVTGTICKTAPNGCAKFASRNGANRNDQPGGVDTDILIDVGREIQAAIDYLQNVERDSTLVVSAITKMELVVGCRNKAELRIVEQFLTRFRLVKLDEIITDTAIDLLQRYRLSHGLLVPDALIAATALSHKAALASKNQKDYRFIDGLNLLAYR